MCSLCFFSSHSWKLLSCIFIDENQLAKISSAVGWREKNERKLFPCIEKLWKRCLQVAKEDNIEIKIEIQGFHWSCYANEIKNIAIELDGCDDKFHSEDASLPGLSKQFSHISQSVDLNSIKTLYALLSALRSCLWIRISDLRLCKINYIYFNVIFIRLVAFQGMTGWIQNLSFMRQGQENWFY